jgi:glutamyl-tRNA synthetase
MSRQELVDAFSLEGINRANAVVNFKEPKDVVILPSTPADKAKGVSGWLEPRILERYTEDMFDSKAVWLNSEHVRLLDVNDLAKRLLPFVRKLNSGATEQKVKQIAPLVRERIKLLQDVQTVADFFFLDLDWYQPWSEPVQAHPRQQPDSSVLPLIHPDPADLIPQKGDAPMAERVLEKAREVLASTEFTHDALDQSLRAAAQELGVKPGQMFQPIRVAVCGRKNAPPLFETLEVLGKEKVLQRIEQAIVKVAG